MTYGLLSTGLVIPTLEEIRADINQPIKDTFGNSIDLSDDDPLGQLIAILSDREMLIWQLLEEVYNAFNVDKNTGAAQDGTAALTGTIRKAAKPSTISLTCTGAEGTSLLAGRQVSNQVTSERFSTLADITLALATAWASSAAYAVGEVRSNGGNIYLVTTAGTSAGSGGPTSELDTIADNTVVWRFLGNGLSYSSVDAESANTGVIIGASGDLNQIETPISGWESVINILDADTGNEVETPGDLRARRELEIANAGKATVDAVYAALSGVAGVTSVKPFWNNLDIVDSDGVPAHGLEVLVEGGEDQDIFDTLRLNLSGGTNTSGTETGTSTDSEGKVHSYNFSRTTLLDIYATVTLTYDADTYPSDGDAQVQAAIVSQGNARLAGFDVVSSAVKAACHAVDGVLGVTIANIGTSVTPTTETTVPVGTRERADYDSSRTVVNSSAATP